MDRSELREYFEKLSKIRGIPMFLDRFEDGSVTSDGLNLHLDIIETDRNRPTVVFIPGTSAYALLYSEFMTALADKGYNIVGLDPRGHGQSEGTRGSYTIGELVKDTRAAVEYARKRFGDPIAVAGSSQGGITALYFAATGDPVAGVVCHNVADLADPSSVKLTRNPNLSRFLKPGLKFFASIFPELKIPIALYLDIDKETMRGFASAKDFIDQDPLVYKSISLKALNSLASEKPAAPIEEIKTPVQILHSGLDNIFPQDYIENIFNRLNCKKSLRVYPNLPHLILTEHVDIVTPDVVEWLEQIC